MKTIEKPWIKLKEYIDHEDYELINKLQERCIHEDQTALKLELDYKLGVTLSNDNISSTHNINEFMYFDGQQIIGYIGIANYGAGIEVNGMVHPEYRRQGVFKRLFELVIAECKRMNSDCILLLSDRKSYSGQKFIEAVGAQYKESEYEMFFKEDNLDRLQKMISGITFRKASNADVQEIARQNVIYFNNETKDSDNTPIDYEVLILPEEEEKRGMTIYLAEKDHQIIGKVNLQLISNIGGIYGLGVLPEHRGKGFGRAILIMAIEKLKGANARDIMLQVSAENSNALNLYKSCGFMETSTMDYYEQFI